MGLSEVGGQVMSWSRCSHVVIRRSGRPRVGIATSISKKRFLDSRGKESWESSRSRRRRFSQRVCQKNRLRSHASKSSRTSSLSRHSADEQVTRAGSHAREGELPRLPRPCLFQACLLHTPANQTAISAHHAASTPSTHVGRPDETGRGCVCSRVPPSCCHHAPRLCIPVTLRGMVGGGEARRLVFVHDCGRAWKSCLLISVICKPSRRVSVPFVCLLSCLSSR